MRTTPTALLVLTAMMTAVSGARAAESDAARRAAPDEVVATVREAVTSVTFEAPMLAGRGLEVLEVTPSVERHGQHPLFVNGERAVAFAAVQPIGLRLRLRGGQFHGLTGGELRHRGGVRLRGPAGIVDLGGIVLRPGPRAYTFELLDATGEAVLASDAPQWELLPGDGRLRLYNADLRILPALARRLGDVAAAGTPIGSLAIDLDFAPLAALPAGDVRSLSAFGTPPGCTDFETGDVDVGLIDIPNVDQAHMPVPPEPGRIVVVPSVRLKNVGTANVPWYAKFDPPRPPYGNDQHPFLVWQMARINDGLLEPLGRSDLKHAFATGNENCEPGACTDPHILGLGCEDLYNFGSNVWNYALGPRAEVTASTGVWAHCDEPLPDTPTHFDADGNCTMDVAWQNENYYTHGMKVAESDLMISGSQWYVEAFYLIRDDTNIFNTMGHRRVNALFGGTTWTFPFLGPYTQGPMVDTWASQAPAGTADNAVVDTGEGHLQLAVRVKELGGGRRRFAYALQNHDYDRRIRSFRVPFATAGGVTNVAFADGDASAGNNWTSTVDASGVTWTAPVGASPPAELDFAMLYAFRFETDSSLSVQQPELGVVEVAPGASPSLGVSLDTPATGFFANGFENGHLGAWNGVGG